MYIWQFFIFPLQALVEANNDLFGEPVGKLGDEAGAHKTSSLDPVLVFKGSQSQGNTISLFLLS